MMETCGLMQTWGGVDGCMCVYVYKMGSPGGTFNNNKQTEEQRASGFPFDS